MKIFMFGLIVFTVLFNLGACMNGALAARYHYIKTLQ